MKSFAVSSAIYWEEQRAKKLSKPNGLLAESEERQKLPSSWQLLVAFFMVAALKRFSVFIIVCILGYVFSKSVSETLMDVTLPISVNQFKSTFVEPGDFSRGVREKCKAKEIEVGRWQRSGSSSTRRMAFLHPVKVRVPGLGIPSHAPTSKTEKIVSSKADYLEIHEVDDISDAVPFSSYFKVHTIWKVSSASKQKSSCNVVMVVTVEFLKRISWLEGKIVKNTFSEAGLFVQAWLDMAHSWICTKQKEFAKACNDWDSVVVVFSE